MKYFFIACVLFFSCSAAYATTYYFDSVNGVDGHAGQISNAVTASGVVGNAIQMNGTSTPASSRVTIPGGQEIRPTVWSVSAWVSPFGTSAAYNAIFSPNSGNGYTSGFMVYMNPSRKFGVRFGMGSAPSPKLVTSLTAVDLQSWHHVAATYDGNVAALYVDGVLQATTSVTIGYATQGTPTVVGTAGGVTSWNGLVDEFGYYNRALTPQEVSTLYAKGIVSQGRILHYSFDGIQGTSVPDSVGNSGVSANSPYKTISLLNSISLAPGDSVLFRRGGVWREQLNVSASGVAGSPITFSSYGDSGAKPIITGADLATSFSQHSGNIYVASVPSGLAVSSVFVDGDVYDVAHYPGSGYRAVTSDSVDTFTLKDSLLTLDPSLLVGADAYVKTVPWRIETKKIASFNDTTKTITFTSSTTYPMKSGYGYYLANKLWMLDAPHEWYYDSALGKLYIWLEGNENPNNHVVEYSVRPRAIYASAKQYITIDGVNTSMSAAENIYFVGGNNVSISNIESNNAVTAGVSILSTGAVVVKNSTLSNNKTSGVYINSISSGGYEVSGNVITNTGYAGELKQTTSCAGVCVGASDNGIIKGNTINYTGYAGISYSGKGGIIENNVISHTCLVIDDCAGIYSWGGTTYNPLLGGDNTVRNNFVSNSIGNFQGTAVTTSQAEGIYLDDLSHDFTVTGNTVVNTQRGIYIHNGINHNVSGNTIVNARMYGLWIKEDINAKIPGVTVGNVINNNIFVGATGTTVTAHFEGRLGFTDFGTYSNNYYVSSYSTYPIARTITSARSYFTLDDWKQTTLNDQGSVDVGQLYQVVPEVVTNVIGTNVIANGQFSSVLTSWSKYSSDSSMTMNWEASCGLDGGCLHATTNITNSISYSVPFAITAGKSYKVSFSVLGVGTTTANALIIKNTSPFTTYASYPFTITTNRKNESYSFTASVSSPDARFNFVTDSSGVEYYLDSVSVEEVSVSRNRTEDDWYLFTNQTATAQTITPPARLYCDVTNSALPASFTLAPYTSRYVISCFNNNDRVCNNHETHTTAPEDCPQTTDEGSYAYLDRVTPSPSAVPSPTQSQPTFSSGGGGGGGSGTFFSFLSPFKKTQQPQATTTPKVSIATTSQDIFLVSKTPTNNTSVGAQSSCVQVFKKNLSRGTRHTDVKALQKYLNRDPRTRVAATGVGSPGKETIYFGTATEKAVRKYQALHLTELNIKSPTGKVMSLTRGLMNCGK